MATPGPNGPNIVANDKVRHRVFIGQDIRFGEPWHDLIPIMHDIGDGIHGNLVVEGVDIGVELRDTKNEEDFSEITGNDDVPLTWAEMVALFDEDLTTGYLLEDGESMSFLLKRPHDVHHIKLVDGSGCVIHDPDIGFILFYADGTMGMWDGSSEVMIKKEIIFWTFFNGSGDDLFIAEVIAKQFNDTRVFADFQQPLQVTDQDYACAYDFDITRSLLASTVGITTEMLIEMLDFDYTNVTIPATAPDVPREVVFVPKSMGMQVYEVAVMDINGVVIERDDIHLLITDSMGRVRQEDGILGMAEIKCPVRYITILMDANAPALTVAQLLVKKYDQSGVHAPIEQPLLTSSQDYATPQDFDMEKSVDASDIPYQDLYHLLNQDWGPVAIPASQGVTTIKLYPKTAAMQIMSIAVIATDGQVYSIPDAVLSVRNSHESSILATHDQLWLPEIKFTVNEIIITFPAGEEFSIMGISIKKYQFNEVHSPSQQPTKVEEDQEITLQDVERIEIGQFSHGASFGELADWLADRILSAAEMKVLLNKNCIGGLKVELPHDVDDNIMLVFLKTPRYVKDLEFLDAYGMDIHAIDGINIGWYKTNGLGLPIQTGPIDDAYATVEQKITVFGIENLTLGDIGIYEVTARTFKDSRVYAPESEPLNVNELGQMVAEDIVRISVYVAGEPPTNYDLQRNDIEILFDKSLAGHIAFPAAAEITIYFKIPFRLKELEALDEDGYGIVLDWAWTSVKGDLSQFDDTIVAVVDNEIPSVTIINPDPENPVDIYELVFKKFLDQRMFGQDWIPNLVIDNYVEVADASTAVLAANTDRKYACFVNDSDNIMYLGIGTAAVVGSGIRLNPKGGSYELNWTNMTKVAINAIATVAGSNLTVVEGT